jgi:hypothetical protein
VEQAVDTALRRRLVHINWLFLSRLFKSSDNQKYVDSDVVQSIHKIIIEIYFGRECQQHTLKEERYHKKIIIKL